MREPEAALLRPLGPGEPVTYWRIGETAESRFDVADQPMKGEMDPFFFLTKTKNFIPHEYPCRTEFAAANRGKRPSETVPFAAEKLWLPFASPRVDLSGFWFRPTRIGTWAETVLRADTAGKARLRLRTCGGAILFVNGQEIGWMAPYIRNLENEAEFSAPLLAGDNIIRVWFDDLAERDARYYFQLDFLDGPSVRHALPIAAEPSVADAMEEALASMRFERPAYDRGEVALIAGNPIPADITAEISVEGDFMSIEEPVRFSIPLRQGETRLAIADAVDLPADFRHFIVTLRAGDLAVSRTFGVEISHAARQGDAPATLPARIAEALNEVAEHAEADTVRALARLATGKAGPETDAMIANALPAIEDCHDCADFILVPLLWCRIAYGDAIDPALRDRIDAAILNYRYWMDEKGNDVQWYFSENHALLFHTAAYLAGDLLPDAGFVRSGRTGAEQSATGAARVRAWLDHFEKWEMAEFNSAPYFPIDLKGLCALYALAPDDDIRDRAGRAIQRLLYIVARSAHHGILTAAQGRSYEHTLRAARTLELSGIARMIWGKGNYGMRFHALPQLALCLRDHGLDVPDGLSPIASVPAGTQWEWVFAQGEDAFARLYHYKTADFAMGSAAAYRWNEWGYQETVLHLRLGQNPNAQIWINHPGEVLQSGYGRPSYWGGSGTLPRLHQYKALAIAEFAIHEGQPGFTHAWFPAAEFTQSEVSGHQALAEAGDAFALIRANVALRMLETGPTAGNELRADGPNTLWLVRLGDRSADRDMAAFGERFAPLELHRHDDGVIEVDDPEYGSVLFRPDGSIKAEGRELDPADWRVEGAATEFGKT
ncbi:hypothetical protein FQV27_04620 [Paracoccus aurantiacus]|uniref:Uncharacterized protein n=1 Tax=Paracoccus aurantiacus TaxID=2599412 RepID=A0A5C6SAD7_9RHOB|nr:hypothetical protein FQV27_04620 [Paracoccus aurantiacus]